MAETLVKNQDVNSRHQNSRYSHLSKEDLIKVVEKLDSRKKYGLIWDEEKVKEQFERDAENALPILREVKEKEIIAKDASKPVNVLIEGDNYHALSVLNFTHQRKIDVIYIDPPYNTRNKDFKYNDRFIDKEDSYRHSKWISFMSKRLRLAKNLLKDIGVIFISIDDNEQAQLKLLCDEIFGGENFIGQLVWGAGRKNDSTLISNSHEYILCYVSSLGRFKEEKITWRKRKEGLDDVYAIHKQLKRKYKDDFEKIQSALGEWYKGLAASDPARRLRHYSHVDKQGIYFAADISWPGGGGPKYKVIHPITKRPCKVPARGWMFSKPEKMQEAIKENRVHFGPNETFVPCIKAYLTEREFEVPYSLFYQDGRAATKRLREILGDNTFDNPKDENILAEIINFSGPKDAVVLDFFAGSGTTGHSVLELNKRDNGKRSFILCTNNEGKICENITYPRIEKIIKGYKTKDDEKVEGFDGSLKYFRTKFIKKSANKDDLKIHITKECTEMLCLREGIFDEIKITDDYRIFQKGNNIIAAYYSLDRENLSELKKELNKLDGKKTVYCFTLDPVGLDKKDFNGWKDVIVEAIPQKILDVYKQIYEY